MLTPALADGLADGLVAAIRDFVSRKLNPVDARIKALEERLATMEKKIGDGLRYRGVFEADTPYAPGDFVTRSGSLWHCRSRTEPGDVPGQSDRWQLAVKRGADGRDWDAR
jgi:hypothetical protein